jgi:electron transfer flavoprotein alpha/beta subunit
LQLKKQYPDARLLVCSMGPPSFETSLRKAMAMGYDDAYLLSDRKLGGSDTFAPVGFGKPFAVFGFFESK